MKKENNKKNDNSYWLPIRMCLGISIGTTVGAATKNMGLWISIGLCLGMSLGIVFSSTKDKNDKK